MADVNSQAMHAEKFPDNGRTKYTSDNRQQQKGAATEVSYI